MAASTLVDLVKLNVQSTGAGAFALGSAVPGYRGVEALVDGAVYSYSVQQDAQFEFGRGTYLASLGVLARSPFFSSDGGAAVNFGPNISVAFTFLAEDLLQILAPPEADATALAQEIARATAAERTLAQRITTSAAGLRSYATYAALTADTSRPIGTLAYVFNDPDPTKNSIYTYESGGWVEATWFYEGLANIVQPLVNQAQAAASAAAASAAQAAAIAGRTTPPAPQGVRSPFTMDFTAPGLVDGVIPGGVIATGPATAIMDSGALSVTRDWGLGNLVGHVIMPQAKFAEGVLRILVARRPFMVEIEHTDFTRYAVWSADGQILQFGHIDDGNGTTQLASCTLGGVSPGIADEDVWVELTRGPSFTGATFLLRSWLATGRFAIPGDAGYAQPIVTGVPMINEGWISFSSFSGQPARIRQVQLHDARYGVAEASSKATFVGRWFDRFEAFEPVMATTRGGSRLRLKTNGTASVGLRYAVPPNQTYAPVGDVFVNGTRTGGPITFGGQAGTLQTQVIAIGLDPTQTSNIELRVRGVHENDDKWNRGIGFLVQDLYAVDNGGAVQPWPDDRDKALFLGNSITEGIAGRGDPSTPSNAAGDASWPALLCDALNLQPVINGFGGTGLLTTGSGGMPPTIQNAFNYMNDRPIDTVAEGIKYIFLNIGTNDLFVSNASPSAFQAAYDTLVRKLLVAHPSARVIYCIRPFNDDVAAAYAQGIQAVVTDIGRGCVQYVDTTGWGVQMQAIDTVHPTLVGHQTAATKMIAAVGAMTSSYT